MQINLFQPQALQLQIKRIHPDPRKIQPCDLLEGNQRGQVRDLRTRQADITQKSCPV